MKAVVINQPNSIKVIEVDSSKVEPDQVLVKVSYCGICGTDFDIYKGLSSFVKDNLVQYPVRIGHEWSGIIEKVGSEVKSLKLGDRIVGDGKITCGFCKYCKEGKWGKCINIRALGTVGDNWDGALAEYITIPARNVFKLPENISLKEAAVMEPAAIAMNALVSAEINSDTSVLIIGTGPIGLAAVGLSKALGVSKVFLAGRKELKLNIGKQMGADVLINTTKQSLEDIIINKTEGQKVDLVVETSGNIETIYQSINTIAKMGTISLIGFYERKLNNIDINNIVLNKISILGIGGTNECFPDVINLIEKKKIDLKPLITHMYKFDQIEEAFKAYEQENDKRIKVLVNLN